VTTETLIIEQIGQIYQNAFRRLDTKRDAPPVTVEFYGYVGLRHTIRIRNGRVLVRLSDLTKNAEPEIHDALALILVAKLLRKKIPTAAAIIYTAFAREPRIAAAADRTRRQRGRKIVTAARGRVYDLEEIFASLNQRFFDGAMKKPVLSWSKSKTRRIFGHHDALHETIVISRPLDDARIPRFVTEFVLYHELLHIKHPARIANGRRQIHSPAFRRDERDFPDFEAAEKWLARLAGTKRRGSR
jgi:hypothetical protein